MPTQFSAPQIDQLRRNAKRLGRTLSITHSEALDRVAAVHGFRNWSLLSKQSGAGTNTPSPPVRPAASARPQGSDDPRRRYYLHGDQYEDDHSRYYCSQCDVFFKADHFASHGQHTGERCLRAEEHWAKRDAQSKMTWRRPDTPVNILRGPALAARAQYRSLRPAFSDWLLAQGRRFRNGERNDDISFAGASFVTARGLPKTPKSLTQLREHYERRGRHRSSLDVLDAAWSEFLALQPARQ